MIKEISRDIKIEEIPETKQFKVFVNIVQISDAQDMVSNLEGIRATIKSDKETLEIKREKVEENITKNESVLKMFSEHENKARLWTKEVELRNKRTGKVESEAAMVPDPEEIGTQI